MASAASVERFSLTSLDAVAALGLQLPEGAAPRFNIARMQRALIWTAEGLHLARWGMLPPWRGHGGKRDPHVTHAPRAAIEGVPLIRNAFQRQRCLVLADGVFAWRRAGKKPQPYWVHAPHIVGFAGVAATHRDDEQPSFALLTGPSAGLGRALVDIVGASDGWPVAISTRDAAAWFGARETALALLASGASTWRADAVSTWVNDVAHDDVRCVAPLGNPAQGELF